MSQRFCTGCGHSLADNARFCESCGSAVTGPAVSQQAPPPPPVYQAPVAPPPPQNQPPVAQPPPQDQPPPVYQQAPPAYQPPPQQAYQPPPQYQPPPPQFQPPPVYQQPPQAYAPPAGYAPQYGYQPPAQGMPGEAFIGVIPNAQRKKNMFSTETFNIVVTNQRMVFALATSEMIKAEAMSHKGEGIKGAFKAMTAGYTLWRRYTGMSPDQAMAETPGNFCVYLNQVRKVKYSGGKVLFSKGGVSVGMNVNIGLGGGDDDDNAKLEIETIGGKYQFEIIASSQQQTHQVLKAAGLIR